MLGLVVILLVNVYMGTTHKDISRTQPLRVVGGECNACIMPACSCNTCPDGKHKYGCCGGCIYNDELNCVSKKILECPSALKSNNTSINCAEYTHNNCPSSCAVVKISDNLLVCQSKKNAEILFSNNKQLFGPETFDHLRNVDRKQTIIIVAGILSVLIISIIVGIIFYKHNKSTDIENIVEYTSDLEMIR